MSAFTLVTGFITGGQLPTAFGGPSIGSLAYAGERAGATRLPFTAGDSVKAQVDVGTGNLLVSVKGVTLPGVKGQISIGAFYNSAASDQSTVPRLGRGWGVDYTGDINLKTNADNSVTYSGPGGLTGVFDLKSGSTTSYTSPKGFKVDLVKTSGTGWTLTDHTSQEKFNFNTSGILINRKDRDGNTTTVTDQGGVPVSYSIVGPAGPGASGQASVSTTSGVTTIQQGNGSTPLRSVSFSRAYSFNDSFTDALGRSTNFGYDSTGLLTSIAAPGSVSTAFTYDSSRRVTSITQTETAAGGPGNSVTRLTYPSATQTLLAGPNTDQATAVASVPHTTYTINTDKRVDKAVDAAGRTRSKTYNANFDTASSSVGAGASASTTTNAFNANGGESLTKSSSPTGSSQSLSYANTSGPAQYLPTSGSDDAGNASTYHYTGTGNQDTSTDALAAQAKLDYNTDGTVSGATSPNNGSNKTSYGYTNKLMTSMTPVTGSSLGSRAYTYDTLGRLKTATNGRGITVTYTYDLNDRVTQIAYTGSSSLTVTYGYDTAGRNNSRVDPNGTTSYSYDQLGRLISRQNSAGGGLMKYGYDKASNLVQTITPAGGTTTYSFDDAGVPTKIVYPHSSGGTQTLLFDNDDKGRRTDTWLQANATHTTWAAHQKVTYDDSGRITRVVADAGSGDASHTTVVDLTYCYAAGTTPTGGCNNTTANNRDKLVWKKDNVANKSTTYSYDAAGRLKTAAVSGGNQFDYTYNKNSNRLTADTQTLTFNAANQITTTGYSFDGAGNQTADPSNSVTAVSYTAADQPSSSTVSGTSYTYSHAGTDNNEMLSQTSPDGTYAYAYGRPDQNGIPVVESITRNGGASASVTSDPRTGQPLMLRTTTGTQSLYIYDGPEGSPIALLTDGSNTAFAYDYDPYGVPVLTQTTGGSGLTQNPYTFASGVQDRATGWIHYGNRYYNPKTGTFTQQDTLDAPLDPANANRYAYAANDPINNVDPNGNITRACIKALADELGYGILFDVSLLEGSILASVATGYFFYISYTTARRACGDKFLA